MVCGTQGSEAGRGLSIHRKNDVCAVLSENHAMRSNFKKMGRKKEKNRIEDLPSVTIELMNSLRELLDDSQFIIGSLRCVPDPEDQATLLRFIQDGEDVNVSTVAIRAFELGSRRVDKTA